MQSRRQATASSSMDNYKTEEAISLSNSHIVIAKRHMNSACQKILPWNFMRLSLFLVDGTWLSWKMFEVNTKAYMTLFTIPIIRKTYPVVIIFWTKSKNPWKNYIKLGSCMVIYATPISWSRGAVSMDLFTWWTLTGVGGLKFNIHLKLMTPLLSGLMVLLVVDLLLPGTILTC